VFWGKALYNLGFILISSFALSLVFFTLVRLNVVNPTLYATCLVGGCVALAATGTLCGALVAQASNRSALAAAISIPLLLPLIAIGIAGMRVALGEGLPESGTRAVVGIACYGIASLTIGPQLFAAIWRH
jgi:ABC-type transport system involved in cytochrome c biogenesis permease component